MGFFKRSTADSMSGGVEYIVCGLGNPGKKYERTRHNVGFIALDLIAEKSGISVSRLKFKSLIGVGDIGGVRVLLMKPSTFMNLSGEAVREAMTFYKVPPEKTLLIFDDVSLPAGKCRVRAKGSHGGQNGMKNIIALSGSDEFPRIKIGVGEKPHPDYSLADWVLSVPTGDDAKQISDTLRQTPDIVATFLKDGVMAAMNKHNGTAN